jgi:hypothetical protein
MSIEWPGEAIRVLLHEVDWAGTMVSWMLAKRKGQLTELLADVWKIWVGASFELVHAL